MKTLALAAAIVVLTSLGVFAEDTIGADNTAPPPQSEDNTPAVLSGTLKKIRDSGVVTIGYREASFPFSYVTAGLAAPLGYSIDLCLGIVDEIVRELNGAPTRVAYQRRSPPTPAWTR